MSATAVVVLVLVTMAVLAALTYAAVRFTRSALEGGETPRDGADRRSAPDVGADDGDRATIEDAR